MFRMLKRGQIGVVIIVGLLLLLVLGLFAIRAGRPNPEHVQLQLKEGSAQARALLEGCARQGLLDGMSKYEPKPGNEQAYAGAVEEAVQKCDATEVSLRGFSLAATTLPQASVSIFPDKLTAVVDYPAEVVTGDSKILLSSFSSEIPRTAALQVIGPSAGETLQSPDGRFQLNLQPGTRITLNGQPVAQLGVTIIEKSVNNRGNTILIGQTAYEIWPDGVRFEPAAELVVKYGNLPPGVSPSQVTIASYDEKNRRWVGKAATLDASLGVVKARVDHASPWSVTINCNALTEPQVINLGWVYREPCYSGKRSGKSCSPRWLRGSDGSLYAPPGVDIKVDQRMNFKEGAARCYKKDWGTGDERYGYDSLDAVGGKGTVSFKFVQDGDNTCLAEEQAAKLFLSCDDKCKSVRINGVEVSGTLTANEPKGMRKNEFSVIYEYVFPASALKPTGQENVLEVEAENNAEHCSGAWAMLQLSGIGLLPECGEKIFRNCRCGDAQTVNVEYDYEFMNDLIEDAQKSYIELSDEELAPLLNGKPKYCCNGEVKDACEKKKEEAKPVPQVQQPPAQQPGQPVQEQPPAQVQDCTAQDRINYLCRYGPDNDKNYNPLYPSCSGNANGKPIGFSDSAISGELGYLVRNRQSRLAELSDYITGKYAGICGAQAQAVPSVQPPVQQPPAKESDQCNGKPDGEYCVEAGKSGEMFYCNAGRLESRESLEGRSIFYEACQPGLVCFEENSRFKECKARPEEQPAAPVKEEPAPETPKEEMPAETPQPVAPEPKFTDVDLIGDIRFFSEDGALLDPSRIVAGKKTTVRFTLANKGEVAAKGFKVAIVAGDRHIQEIDELSPGAEMHISLEWMPEETQKTVAVAIDPDKSLPQRTVYFLVFVFIKVIPEPSPECQRPGFFCVNSWPARDWFRCSDSLQKTEGACAKNEQCRMLSNDLAMCRKICPDDMTFEGTYGEPVKLPGDSKNVFCDRDKFFFYNGEALSAEPGSRKGARCAKVVDDCQSLLPPSEPQNGEIKSEAFQEQIYMGGGNWLECNDKSSGNIINPGGGFDLLCVKNSDWHRFAECDTDGKPERINKDSGKTYPAGTILDIKGNDYVCAKYGEFQSWAKCGGERLPTTDGVYVQSGGKIKVGDADYYCCGDRFYTQPCEKLQTGQELLCLHTEFSSPSDEDRQIQLARDIGASYVKQTFTWRQAQPSKPVPGQEPQYSWRLYDSWFAKIRAKNLKVIARISTAPDWARTEKGVNTGYTAGRCKPHCGEDARPDMDRLDDFEKFVYEFVKRYKPEYVQIWNEPNLADEWSAKGPNPAEYGELLRRGFLSARLANRDTKVILGGLAPTGTYPFSRKCNEIKEWEEDCRKFTPEQMSYLVSMNDFDFMDELYKADPLIGQYYAVLGLNSHPIQETDPAAKCDGRDVVQPFTNKKYNWMLKPKGDCWGFGRVEEMRNHMKEQHNSEKPVSLMEMSYYTNSYYLFRRDEKDLSVMRDEEIRQAAKLRDAYGVILGQWKDWAGPACWFIASEPTKWQYNGNIIRTDYTLRPTGCAYSRDAASRPYTETLREACSSYKITLT